MATESTQAESSDTALLDLLSALSDYTPTIPDELAEHYLSSSGFQCPDIRVTRLLSVATQKFIAEIASDALQYSRMRQSAALKEKDRGQSGKGKKLVMTSEDLAVALKEYGINIRRQEYYADSPLAGINPPSKDKLNE